MAVQNRKMSCAELMGSASCGYRMISLDEVGSTNRWLREQADRGEYADEDIVCVTAEHQTAGRGMGKNTWESEDGKNLLFSLLVHPTMVPPRWQYLLSMTMALALRDAIAKAVTTACGDDKTIGKARAGKVTIKWPNDIYYEDSKISGTLIDLTLTSSGIKNMVIGTGVNVNQQQFLSDAPNPVSLLQITGEEYSRKTLLTDIMENFQKLYSLLLYNAREDGTDILQSTVCKAMIDEYHSHLYRKEDYHTYADNNGPFLAEIVHVAPDGILTLRCQDGSERQYEFKEVKFVI